MTMECVEKIIKKDMVDPTNGKKLTDKDIILLQRVRILIITIIIVIFISSAAVAVAAVVDSCHSSSSIKMKRPHGQNRF